MEKSPDLVVAHRSANRTEAEIVRLVLEDAGIIAVIPDRHFPFPADMKPLDDEFVPAGCEVLVPARDLERAQEAIAEARAAGQAPTEGEGEDGAT
jgi:hypothetical protein